MYMFKLFLFLFIYDFIKQLSFYLGYKTRKLLTIYYYKRLEKIKFVNLKCSWFYVPTFPFFVVKNNHILNISDDNKHSKWKNKLKWKWKHPWPWSHLDKQHFLAIIQLHMRSADFVKYTFLISKYIFLLKTKKIKKK